MSLDSEQCCPATEMPLSMVFSGRAVPPNWSPKRPKFRDPLTRPWEKGYVDLRFSWYFGTPGVMPSKRFWKGC